MSPRSELALVFKAAGGIERTYTVEGAEIRIGRDSSCHVIVGVDGIEAVHCRLLHNGARWSVEDCGTRAGTFLVIAGQPIPQMVLKPRTFELGDEILIGHESAPLFRGSIQRTTRTTEAPVAKAEPAKPADAPKASARAPAVEPAELDALRAQLAKALQERDANAVALDLARRQLSADSTRVQTMYENELQALTGKLQARDSQLVELTKKASAADEERKAAVESMRAERRQREEALRIAEDARRDANADRLVAQQRAIVIEELSGRVAELDALLGERDQELKNRAAEVERLSKKLRAT